MENMYKGKSDRNPNKPLYLGLIAGLLFIAFGVYLYFDLARWENSDEEMHLHRLLWVLYDLGGKFAVSGLFALVGIISIWSGAKKTNDLRNLKTHIKN